MTIECPSKEDRTVETNERDDQDVIRPLGEGVQRFFKRILGFVGLGWEDSILEFSSGNEEDFRSQYEEYGILGEGEFGTVMAVGRKQNNGPTATTTTEGEGDDNISKTKSPQRQLLACKYLKKGLVFKDNVIHTPLKTNVLKNECEALKMLKGDHFTLKMIDTFESFNVIFLVTEHLEGQNMLDYKQSAYEGAVIPLSDVSRISFQLLDAVNHCAAYNVIHRDIKPDNIMFETQNAGSPLRLIDFGSCAIDRIHKNDHDDQNNQTGEDRPPKCLDYHSTYAGAGFYNSPEMFQRKYTQKTDIWSVGVVLYVLVAGYPLNELQKAFDHMHKKKHRNLRELPQMPSDIPDSYIHLLNTLLEYKQNDRKHARDILGYEFIRLHNNTQ